MRYDILVLSAGESRRMGYYPKALLKTGDGEKFLEKIIKSIKRITNYPEKIIVVLGYHREIIEKEIDLSKNLVVVNPDPSRGMHSSIQEGIKQASNGIDGILLCLVDHPLVRVETYAKIIKHANESPGHIIIPVCSGRKGHPVFFPCIFFEDLRNCPQEEGARWVVSKNRERVKIIQVEDPGIYMDIDTPDSYGNRW